LVSQGALALSVTVQQQVDSNDNKRTTADLCDSENFDALNLFDGLYEGMLGIK
jgi:hypothetical protein